MSTIAERTFPDPDAVLESPTRVNAVRQTGLVDSPPEDTFDRLTALASKLLGVPTVLISLCDQDRDFLKSRHGLPAELDSLTQLDGRTFCHFAITGRKPLRVDDASLHPELKQIDAVARLGVKAYAGVPLIDEQGNAIGAFCAVDFVPRHWSDRDIDVLVELAHSTMREIKLRQALEEARSVLVDREEMMAVVAHDLRTPLSVITMYGQLLSREALPEKAGKMVDRLRRTADSMGQLIRSLLEMSQVDAGSVVLSRHPADPIDLLNDAVGLHEAEAAQAGVALTVDCEAGLPEVSVDHDRIMRVFESLVGNALRFSKPGGTVTVAARLSAGQLEFTVRDTGDGIPAAELQGLLARFWQVKLHERRGAGFGLAIAGGLVAAHGGALHARSVVGQGSEFGFTLPLSGARSAAESGA